VAVVAALREIMFGGRFEKTTYDTAPRGIMGVRPNPLLLNDKKFSLRSALGKLKVSAQTDVAPTL